MAGTIDLGPLCAEPEVRLIIPCRNEAGYIDRCLGSIVAAARPARFKALICDGMSTDGTREQVMTWASQHPWITLIDNPERTTPQALNIGLKHGAFDVAIILGAHATIDHDFIAASLEALRSDSTVGCAGGFIRNEYQNTRSRWIGAAMGHPFGVGNAHFRTGTHKGYVDTVAFGAYRKEVFDRVGHLDERLVRNQDDEFNFRIVHHGMRILLDPAIQSTYFVRGTYGKLFRQYHQYGYWKVYVNRKHRTVTTLRQLVPAVWVAALVAGLLLALSLGSGMPLALILTPYLLASAWASFQAAGSASDVPGVWAAFWVLHVAYGTGYWRGIIHLLVFRGEPRAQHGRSSR